MIIVALAPQGDWSRIADIEISDDHSGSGYKKTAEHSPMEWPGAEPGFSARGIWDCDLRKKAGGTQVR